MLKVYSWKKTSPVKLKAGKLFITTTADIE